MMKYETQFSPLLRLSYALLGGLLLAGATVGCKKDVESGKDNSGFAPDRCRIATITFHGAVETQTKVFSYDEAGRLIRLRTSPQVYANDINLNFLYPRTGSIIVQHLDLTGAVSGADTIIYDLLGRVKSISYPPAKDSKEYLRFLYNASTGALDSVVRDIFFTISNTYLAAPWYYQWKDGNLIADSSFLQGKIDYTYYSGTTAQGPEYDLANEYRILDRPYTRSLNLRKDMSSFVHHSYAFDAGGKIIADTSIPASNLQYETYTYECH